jgi:hypothetical protein
VTVYKQASSTNYTLTKILLPSGSTLSYGPNGWSVVDTAGSLQQKQTSQALLQLTTNGIVFQNGEQLSLVMSAAVTTTAPVYHISYSASNGGIPASSTGTLNGTTPVTALNNTTSGLSYVVTGIQIYNNDTVNQTITVNKIVSSSTFTCKRITLFPGYTASFNQDGWQVTDTYGNLQTNTGYTTGANGIAVLDSNGLVPISLLYPSIQISKKNLLINGRFDIWQRTNGVAITSTSFNGYGADKWKFNAQVSTGTCSRQPFTAGQTAVPGNPYFYLQLQSTTANNAGSIVQITQFAEDVSIWAGQTITISFWACADTSGRKIAVELGQYFAGSPASVTGLGVQQFTLGTSWAYYSFTYTMPAISAFATGGVATSASYLSFWLDAGSNFNSRTNSLGTQSGTLNLAQVQVTLGASAPTYTDNPTWYQTLIDCQRYFEKSYDYGVNPAVTNNNSGAYNFYLSPLTSATFGQTAYINYRSQKRIQPTVTIYSTVTGASGKVRDNTAAADVSGTIAQNGMSGFGLYTPAIAAASTAVNISAHWTSEADI